MFKHSYKHRIFIFSLVAVSVVGLLLNFAETANAQTTTTNQPEISLPNTPAGNTVKAFIEAINSGDKAKMLKFHLDRSDGSADAKSEAEENSGKDFGFYEQSGGVKVIRILSADEDEIEVVVQPKKGGRELSLKMMVSTTPPYPVEMIGIRPFTPSTPAPESVKTKKALTPQELPREVESYLDKLSQEDKFSGVALVAQDGKPLFQKAYGQANKSHNIANNLTTKFNLGSMNKMFTSVAIAQLVQRGKLSFDDKVGKILPDYPNKDVREKVTIHHLLTHTSGLGSYWNKKFDEKRMTIRTVADYLSLFAEDPLLFEPGVRFNYSNSGFIVLGAIIEKVTGQNYYDYARENIFKPAGMNDTDYYEQSKQTPNLAMGYTTHNAENARVENTSSRPNRGGPAGGGYSTVGDLVKFHQALQSGKLINAETLKTITSAKGKDPKNGYAYGFGNRVVNGKHSFGHNGGAPGISAELTMFPETNVTVVLLSNYDPENLMPVMQTVMQMVTQTSFQNL